MAQEIAQLVAIARDLPGLTWLFIGGGAGIDQVKAATVASGADNVIFKPYQPRDQLSESLSVPDVHLISLDPACEGYIVPSKVYGVAAVERPVLFLGALDGAVAQEMSGRVRVLDPAHPLDWLGVLLAAKAEWRSAEVTQAMVPSTQQAIERWRSELDGLERT